jgi:hypothetical protein
MQRTNSEILFPAGEEYTLSSGGTVTVKPWSIETLKIILQRLPKLVDAMRTEDEQAPLVTLFPRAIEELEVMIAVTLGWTQAELAARCTAGDVLGLADLTWQVCVEREALAEKLGRLMVQLLGGIGARQPQTPQTPKTPSPKRSTS